MKKIFTSVFIAGWFQFLMAQANMVPNPSFELYDTCPDFISQLQRATYWTNPLTSTPDYFNLCDTSDIASVPQNRWGYQYAHTGVAYAGIFTAKNLITAPAGNNYREYMQSELIDSMVAGITYCVSFFVSAGDSLDYVADNIGAYFSPTEIHYTCSPCALPFEPQIENAAGDSPFFQVLGSARLGSLINRSL